MRGRNLSKFVTTNHMNKSPEGTAMNRTYSKNYFINLYKEV